ncbi:MAG: serine protease [Sphingomonadales bacterium]|nr:serine protease [Sphingomonadales bacterium]
MALINRIAVFSAAWLWLLASPFPLRAQDAEQTEQSGCEIGVNCAANSVAAEEEEPPVDPKLSKDFVLVALADSLGEDRAAVKAIVRATPNIRIADSLAQSEYMIARYPDFPDNLILVPYAFYQWKVAGAQSPTEEVPDISESLANLFARFDGDGGVYQLPPVVGRLDDSSIASGLSAEIQKTLWSRRILGGPIPRLRDDVTTEIFGPRRSICKTVDNVKQCKRPYWTVVRNEGPDPAHIAILRLDQAFAGTDNLVRLKDSTPLQLNPGDARSVTDDEFETSPDVYKRYIVTIASDQPIDLSLFNPRNSPLPRIPENWTVTATAVPQEKKAYRVGGGFTVANLATPWQVQLYSTDSSAASLLAAGKINWQLHEKTHRCGGSLIELNVVLTAAHCIANAPFATPDKRQTVFKFRRVKLGTKDLTRGGTTFAIDAVIVKKGYVPGGNHHDIALLRIKPDASTIARAAAIRQPVSIASRPPAPTTIVSAFGWGVMQEAFGRNTRISSTGAPQRNPAELQTGDLQILDQTLCKARAGYGHVTKLMLCAVTPRNSQAAREGRHVFTCLGDSGGPIMGSEGGRRVQVGVVSWAVGCGVNDNPSVSANVAAYSAWINENKTKFETGKSIER